MKFLIDNQLPVALSRFLEQSGVKADVQLDCELSITNYLFSSSNKTRFFGKLVRIKQKLGLANKTKGSI